MTFSVDKLPQLSGKTIVVTGGNSGIGLEAARVFARKGAQVVLACRDLDKAEAAAATIRATAPASTLSVAALDLASLASVRAFAQRFADSHAQLHVLVNNAGVMAIPRMLTQDGFEMQLGVNHHGHFALTGLLLPQLLAAGDARVVNVASLAHRMGKLNFDDLDGARSYAKWRAYGQSKLANLLFSFELARKLEKLGGRARSVACHPGYAATNLQFVGPQLEQSVLGKRAMQLGNRLFAQSAEAGAWPTLYAALAADANNGDYIGPQGFREMAGPPGHVKARRAAHNPEIATRLWETSVERTGVRFDA